MNSLTQIDKVIFQWINSGWSNSILDFIMPLISHLGDSYAVWFWIIFISIITGWQLIRFSKTNQVKEYKRIVFISICLYCLYMALIFGINAWVYTGIKDYFHRPRPFMQEKVMLRVSKETAKDLHEKKSFPSGHACNAFMIAVLFASRIRRKKYVFFAMAAMVAISRVYLGVHYPGDVIAGSLIGLIITSLMLSFIKQPEMYFEST